MGKRLSKIYTRTGDDDSTGLGDGARVAKENLRVEAYGTVDETNCAIGAVLAPVLAAVGAIAAMAAKFTIVGRADCTKRGYDRNRFFQVDSEDNLNKVVPLQ